MNLADKAAPLLTELVQLLERDGSGGKPFAIAEWVAWIAAVRKFLDKSGAFSSPKDARCFLAYHMGRAERACAEIMDYLKDIQPAVQRRVRTSAAVRDTNERRKAAKRAVELKAQGVRNFVQQVADEYGVSTKQVGRWIKQLDNPRPTIHLGRRNTRK